MYNHFFIRKACFYKIEVGQNHFSKKKGQPQSCPLTFSISLTLLQLERCFRQLHFRQEKYKKIPGNSDCRVSGNRIWSIRDSNPWPPPCHGGALPAAPMPRLWKRIPDCGSQHKLFSMVFSYFLIIFLPFTDLWREGWRFLLRSASIPYLCSALCPAALRVSS